MTHGEHHSQSCSLQDGFWSTQRLHLWLPYTVNPCLQSLQPPVAASTPAVSSALFCCVQGFSKGLCLAKLTEVSLSLLILADVIYLL